MNVDIAARTDVGRVRQVNEDSYLADGPLFAVADGMGGHLAGDIASQIAVRIITEEARSRPPATPGLLEDYVRAANREIWERAHGDPDLSGMGTTCTLLYLDGDQAHLAHVGDSRAYLLRAGELTQLSEDHTLVQRMVNEGRLQPEEANRHPQRSIITRALGVDADVEVDHLTITLTPGDRLLLASDGLSSMIGDGDIKEILARAPSSDEAARQLIAAANEAGGEDNVTVIILSVLDEGELRTAAASPAADPQPRATDEDAPRAPRGSRLRKLLVVVLVLSLLAGAAYAAARYTIDNSWFVGATEERYIAIYRGIPDEIAGLTLKEKVRETTMKVDDLPPLFREDVLDGIKEESREDAEETISNFKDRIRDFGEPGAGDGDGGKSGGEGGGG